MKWLRRIPLRSAAILEFVGDLPRTLAGKMRRVELRELELRRARGEAAPSAP